MERKFGKDYYRISEVYFSYSDFLYETGRSVDALQAHQNALKICLSNYGRKHPLVSLAYKQLADYYFNQSEFLKSLEYYQNALIAIDNKFNDHDLMANPSIDSSLFELRLLDILKNKSKAMNLYASGEKKDSIRIRFLKASLLTSDLAFRLIDRIRNNYLTEESRLYLSRAERETYITGVKIAGSLFTITGDNSYRIAMYDIAQRAKAANLRNDILAKEAFRIAGIPDSIQEQQTRLASTISAYSMLISDAAENQGRDHIVLQSWKDELFNLNRKMEKLASGLAKSYPAYYNLLRKGNPVPLIEIQSNLDKDETIIDYLITEPDIRGSSYLFIFLISGDDFQYNEIRLDTSFLKNAMIIKKSCLTPDYSNINNYANALGYMYKILIRPVEKWIKGDKITIIPDGEISYLPFEAFIFDNTHVNISDFSNVQFLINKYSISYSFSSSLILRKNVPKKSKIKVLSFVPFYEPKDAGFNTFSELGGALNETHSIYKWFSGKRFEGPKATVEEFRKEILKTAIFHLAMHSYPDTNDSRYSYLQFWTADPTKKEGRLFNYEISLSEMNSPMVVLSACNSGSGILYHGEGIVSLARGFILAGASSVVKTSWDINDEVSAEIVTRYYKKLSEGNSKDESLRFAKLEYLKGSPPSYSHPYYWASYELVGDNSPLIGNDHWNKTAIILFLTSGCLLIVFYLRWRRIFPDSRL
jgi:CHAT domain-containing protein